MIYKKIIRPIFFQFDPEDVHHFVITVMKVFSEMPLFSGIIKNFTNFNSQILSTKIGNLNFSNPVGLSAGFDKNVVAPLAYEMLGFGFSELGSVTYSAQVGNPRPRLWRIPKDKGLIVFYGLCNIGALAVAEKLSKLKNKKHPIGISIAPTTGLKLEEMAVDYLKSFELLAPHADFVTLNVSCPNVASCDIFSQVGFIRELTKTINDFKKEKKYSADLFLKIGPDMSAGQYKEIVEICVENGIAAIVATNLIKKRESIKEKNSTEQDLNHPGGISGGLLTDKSNEVIKILYRASAGRLQIIGVGGIFSAQNAYEKIKAGAGALELITGFIYGGPAAIMNINKGLAELLKRDGYKNIEEAVGSEA